MLKLSSSSKGSNLGTSSFSIMWRIFYSYNHLPLVQQHLLYLHYWSKPPPSWSPSTSTWFFSILLPQLQHLQKLNWWFNNTSTTTTYSEDSGVVSRSLNNQVTNFLEEWKLYFVIDWGVLVIIKYMFCGGWEMNICFCTWRGDIILLMKYLNYYCDKCSRRSLKIQPL